MTEILNKYRAELGGRLYWSGSCSTSHSGDQSLGALFTDDGDINLHFYGAGLYLSLRPSDWAVLVDAVNKVLPIPAHT